MRFGAEASRAMQVSRCRVIAAQSSGLKNGRRSGSPRSSSGFAMFRISPGLFNRVNTVTPAVFENPPKLRYGIERPAPFCAASKAVVVGYPSEILPLQL